MSPAGEIAAREQLPEVQPSVPRRPAAPLTHRRRPPRLVSAASASRRGTSSSTWARVRRKPAVQLVDQCGRPLQPRHQHVDVHLALLEEVDDRIELPAGLGVAQLVHRDGVLGAAVMPAPTRRVIVLLATRVVGASADSLDPAAHRPVGEARDDLLPHAPARRRCAPRTRRRSGSGCSPVRAGVPRRRPPADAARTALAPSWRPTWPVRSGPRRAACARSPPRRTPAAPGPARPSARGPIRQALAVHAQLAGAPRR